MCVGLWVTTMALRRLKLNVTLRGQGQDAVGLTSILDLGQYPSYGCDCPIVVNRKAYTITDLTAFCA